MPSFEHDVTLTIEFEVFCAKCGAGLCHQSTTGITSGRGRLYVSIEPCDTCIATAHDEGYNDGVKENE